MSAAHEVTADLDRDAMYRTFEDAPGDLAGYGAMADRLDEIGYAALAHAFRWMQRRGRWPHRREWYAVAGLTGRPIPQVFRWAWYIDHGPGGRLVRKVYPVVSSEPHSVPRVLILQPHKYYPSHQAAVMELARWLQRLKNCFELDEREAVVSTENEPEVEGEVA